MSSDGVALAYIELRHWFEALYQQGLETAMAVDIKIWGIVCGVSPRAVRDALTLLESEGRVVVVDHIGPYAVCQWIGE